ncbi:serine protease [Streptomyces sp. NPDC002054]|uniref:S1 family peptidase n=1 Tax=Streptomyces sp. NPDC002054 TaxID=3154663 RepID=UPI0033323E8A
MFFAKSSRRRATLAGAATAIAAALMATLAAPAGAAPQSNEPSDARLMSIIKSYTDANKAEAEDAGPQKDTMIIGGKKEYVRAYPYMAQVFFQDKQGRGYFCSGSVVGPRKILTAAHCVYGRDMRAGGVVVTGASHLADGSSLYGGKLHRISKQWRHPKYNSKTFDNDVAVLTLSTATSAKPVKVTTASDTASYKPGTKAVALGWGRTTSRNQNISDHLRKAEMPINADSKCSSPNVWGSRFIKGHMLCVGKPATGSDNGTVTICNGDSGGPLVVNGRVVGITSWVVLDCVARGAYPVFVKYSAYANIVAPQLRN